MTNMKISRFIPRRIPALFRARNQLGRYAEKIRQIKRDPDRFVYLVGTPIHTNLGDHLIALSEIQFLEREFGMQVMDIPTEMFQLFRITLKRIIPASRPVCITGGGWMGDMWPVDERTLEKMALAFRNNPAIVFPQTIYYEHPEVGNGVSRRAEACFKACRDTVLCVRDQNSYDYATAHYRNKVMLCPDIAMYYRKPLAERSGSGKRIGICFRDDRERVRHVSREDIIRGFGGGAYEFVKLSTIHETPVSCEERKDVLDALIDAFHSCDLVIADRLHAMILSYIAQTPCLAFDNRTHKVAGVHDLWLKDIASVQVLDNDSDVGRVVEEGKRLMGLRQEAWGSVNDHFQEIKEVIRAWQK